MVRPKLRERIPDADSLGLMIKKRIRSQSGPTRLISTGSIRVPGPELSVSAPFQSFASNDIELRHLNVLI
jgi:hypothetical protein